jgi:nicotinamidase-related amidase
LFIDNQDVKGMLDINNCCLVVVDLQGKLAQLMHEKEKLFANIQILINFAKILDIPIIWCQQYPDGLGPTVPQIARLLADNEPIDKMSFSCCGDEKFNNQLEKLNRRQILLCGIETHVCIYQTALGLIAKSCYVEVIADAVSSRTLENKEIALRKMAVEGIKITSVEMTLFELLRTAEHPKFKQIVNLIK